MRILLSSPKNVRPKSKITPEGWETVGVVDTLLPTTGHTKTEPRTAGVDPEGGLPFVATKRAVDDGLNLMSEAVRIGPAGGVVWLST